MKQSYIKRFVIKSVISGLTIVSTMASAETLPYQLKEGKPFEGTKLNVLAVVSPQFEGLEARQKEFEDMTGIEVEWTYVPYDALQERLATMGVAQDSTYDIVNYLDSWGAPNAYWLMPIDDYLKRDGISMDRYPEAFAKSVTFNDKVSGFPIRGHAQLFYYRKDIFEKLGIEPPKTWDEVALAAEKIKQSGENIQPVAMYYRNEGSRQNLFVWLTFLWGAGERVFDDNKCPAWTTEPALKATEDYIALIKNGVANPDSAAFNEEDARISMQQGKSAMYPSWWWVYSAMQDPTNSTLDKTKIGFVGMPAYGKQTVSYAISMPFSISDYSENKDAAWEFMKWLSNPDLEKRNAIEKSINGIQVNNNVVTHIQNLLDPEINKINDDIGTAAMDSLKHSDVMPQIPEWNEIGDILSNVISQSATGSADVRELMISAAEKSKVILQRNGNCQ